MNSEEKTYWEKRQEQTFLSGEKKVQEYYQDLEKAFEQAKKEIQEVIDKFYVRYAIENEVSYTEAQKLLSKTELTTLKDFINKAYEHMNEYNLELNNMSIKARITRYQALEKQIDAILQQLYGIEYDHKGKELLKDIYSETYYKSWYDVDIYHGFHQNFVQVNTTAIDELIKYPWSGSDFSSRLWKQKEHMLQKLTENITTMLVQGKNPSTLSSQFAKTFKTKEYEAYRLLHTESSFIMGQSTMEAYKEDGVKQYQILATLDNRTSEICRKEDNKIYDIDKAVVGVNYPPYHPFCRTTTVPYYEDEDYSEGTRKARDSVTDKTYEVPADMTYKQWYDKYVANNSEAILAENKWKNRYIDKEQYKKYKEVLGKDLGINSLDEFQELKYNEVEDYKLIKLDYSRRIKLIKNLDLKLPGVENAVIDENKFTKYLFDGNNEGGLIKGRLITKKLGYDISNYKDFEKDILKRAQINPSTFKGRNKYGIKYEQRIIFYNKDKKLVNLEVGWFNSSEGTHMTSIYVSEVKNDEN